MEMISAGGGDASSTAIAEEGQQHSGPSDMRHAVTHYTVLEHMPKLGIYLVQVKLQSGRRHQIRQHFAQINHPLLGDVRYHQRALHPAVQRLALHAAETELIVGPESRKVVVRCDLPEDFAGALAALREAEKRSQNLT
jgi:pseudouridylate synthase